MKIEETPICGVFLVQRPVYKDMRGQFERIFCINELKDVLQKKFIKQINYSVTKMCGTVRGLHYQVFPYTETKLITCIKGRIFDVAVDLRINSPTFLHWYGTILSERDSNSLVIPDGCAHGFQTLEENCEMMYLHTEIYSPDHERGVNVLDSKINITWPKEIQNISEKDQNQGYLNENFIGIEI